MASVTNIRYVVMVDDDHIGGVISVGNQMKISEKHFCLIQAYVEKVVYAESNENLEWSLWRQRIGSGLTLTRG